MFASQYDKNQRINCQHEKNIFILRLAKGQGTEKKYMLFFTYLIDIYIHVVMNKRNTFDLMGSYKIRKQVYHQG